MPPVSVDQLRRFETPQTRPQTQGGVYRLRSAADELLYIGVGSNPAGRLKKHSLKAEWWPEVDLDRSAVEWFRRYSLAEMAERLAIRLEQPKYNMIWSSTRPHWSHERGGRPRVGTLEDGAEIRMWDAARYDMENIVLSAKNGRRCLYITRKNWPSAAVVPIELARLAQWCGGPDEAARVLVRYLAEPD